MHGRLLGNSSLAPFGWLRLRPIEALTQSKGPGISNPVAGASKQAGTRVRRHESERLGMSVSDGS